MCATGKSAMDADEITNPAEIQWSFSAQLRGRQSVRATFKLSARAIQALSIAAVHLGIKQKSLFDHLMDDPEALVTIARSLEEARPPKQGRVQKTYVLSRRALDCLERTCRSFNMPRDTLVEYSIARLLPLIEKEREKHENRKVLVDQVKALAADGQALLARANHLLGQADPLPQRLNAAVTLLQTTADQMDEHIQRGKNIETF